MADVVAPNRGTRRREQTRRQLTDAARELITEKGVAGLRIADLTDTADVGRGSFYNHFDSKEALVEAVAMESLSGFAAAILSDLPEDMDPALAASVADRRFIRLAYDDPDAARLAVNLAHGDTVFEEATRPYARLALDRGIESGRFHIPSVDMALIILIGSALTLMRAILENRAPKDADALHAEAVLILWGLPADEAHEISHRPLS